MRCQISIALALPLLMLAACDSPSRQDPAEPAAEAVGSEARSDGQQAGPDAAAPDADVSAAKGSDTVPAPEPAAQPMKPPTSFAQCRSCHSVEPGRNGIGPSLHGIFGKQAGLAEGFKYSPALAQSGISWTRSELDEWMAAPTRKVPGTRMVLGMRNEQHRAEVIDYLETLK